MYVILFFLWFPYAHICTKDRKETIRTIVPTGKKKNKRIRGNKYFHFYILLEFKFWLYTHISSILKIYTDAGDPALLYENLWVLAEVSEFL